SGYKEAALWSETIVRAPGPKRGLLAIADHRPITLDDLPPLPVSAHWFSMSSFEPERLFLAAIEIIKQVGELGPPGSPDQVDGFFSETLRFLQFDPVKDLVGTLGHVHCIYDDAQHGVFGCGLGIAVQVKDATTLRKTIN